MSRSKLLGISVILAAFTGHARAATDDAVQQFNTKKNTAMTIWSYRFGDSGGHDGNYALLTNKGSFAVTKRGKAATLKDWDSPNGNFDVPLFAANRPAGKVTFTSNGQQIVLPGTTMIYHPGYGFPAILSFLAQSAGSITITYKFTHLDWSCGGSGAGIDWSIEKNSQGGALASGHLLSTSQSSIDSTGKQTVTAIVATGDRINFIVDGVANPPNCDSTGLQLTISTP